MIKMFEARDSKDGYWYSLDDLCDMYEDEPVNYSYVHKRLACPCCGEKIVNCQIDDEHEVLESKRNLHQKNCDYYGFKLNQTKVKQKLNKLDPFADEYNGVFSGKPITKKAIARRCVERRLSDDDFYVVKLFYGKVIVKTSHSKDEAKYLNFSIKSPKGDAITLSFQKCVFEKLANEIEYLKNNIDNEIEIAVIGTLTENGEYKNIVIDKENQVKIKK